MPDEGDKSVELQRDDPILSKSEFQHFQGKAIQPHCFRVCHCFRRHGNLLSCGLDPEGTCDGLLRGPLWDIDIYHLFFGVQQRAEELHPSPADTPFCPAAVSFPRHGRTAIRSTSSPSTAPIRCFGRIHVGLPVATACPTQRRRARRNKRLLHFTLSSAAYMHA